MGILPEELPPDNVLPANGLIHTPESDQDRDDNESSSYFRLNSSKEAFAGQCGGEASATDHGLLDRDMPAYLTTTWDTAGSPEMFQVLSQFASPAVSSAGSRPVNFDPPEVSYGPQDSHRDPAFAIVPSDQREGQARVICSNCSTHITPLWRRDHDGLPLCNACGLFVKIHGIPRPMSLRTDGIKKRKRISCIALGSERTRTRSSRNRAGKKAAFSPGLSSYKP
jgi:hypothetical protein